MMAKEAHTLGPWEAEWERFDKEIEIVSLGEGVLVASVDYDDVEHDVAEADARLIAAAPELLEALEWARSEIMGLTRYDDERQFENCFAKLTKAIAKARGEAK